jgi:hypothetical protein
LALGLKLPLYMLFAPKFAHFETIKVISWNKPITDGNEIQEEDSQTAGLIWLKI